MGNEEINQKSEQTRVQTWGLIVAGLMMILLILMK